MTTERSCQGTLACPLTCQSISKINFLNTIVSINPPLHVFCCFCPLCSSSALTALIYISVSHSMTKRPTRPTWQSACISNYLSAGLARVFVWVPAGFSIYLHIWLAVSCLLTVHVLVFSSRSPRNHVSLCFPPHFLCLSAYISTSPPACLAPCLATHRDWHLTTQQERATEVRNSLLWRSLKHDWQDKRLTLLGE